MLPDPGTALQNPPIPHIYRGVADDDLDRYARRLLAHAAGSGAWLALVDHLAALKAAMHNPGASG